MGCDWTKTMRESISSEVPQKKENLETDERLSIELSELVGESVAGRVLPRLVHTKFYNKHIIDVKIDDDQIIRLSADDLENVGKMLLKTVKKSREMMNESR
tara:strand:+ start:630 stop:932 length:303 start_codon:yes stop_codon:yes gene_type:complete